MFVNVIRRRMRWTRRWTQWTSPARSRGEGSPTRTLAPRPWSRRPASRERRCRRAVAARAAGCWAAVADLGSSLAGVGGHGGARLRHPPLGLRLFFRHGRMHAAERRGAHLSRPLVLSSKSSSRRQAASKIGPPHPSDGRQGRWPKSTQGLGRHDGVIHRVTNCRWAPSPQVRLSGYLWKKGSSWLSFSYRRRLVYLRQDELCFVPPPASAAAGLCSTLTPCASCSRLSARVRF